MMTNGGPGDGPDPKRVAQIQANVATMRSKGATDAEVAQYLRSEDAQPEEAPEPIGKGIARSLIQHGFLNFGDELGLVNAKQEDAFEKAHPLLDFLTTIGGGSVVPAAAVALAPALGTTAGAAALAGLSGLISGSGRQNLDDQSPGQIDSRSHGAATEGTAGLVLGPVAERGTKFLGRAASAIADHLHPARVVAREAAPLITPGTQAAIDEINTLAPGGASIASATTPDAGSPAMQTKSRLLGQARHLSADATAGATAENDVVGQVDALTKGMRRQGALIQALNKDVPVTPQVRAALAKARSVIGNYAPDLPAPAAPPSVPGLQPQQVFQPPVAPQKLSTNDLHEIVSRIRDTRARLDDQGINAPGQMKHDFDEAERAIEGVMYGAEPRLEAIDRNYRILADQRRTQDEILKTIQNGRMTGAGNRTAGVNPITPGGSVTTKSQTLLDLAKMLFTPRETPRPKEIARFITKPGGADAVAQLLKHLPAKHPVLDAVRGGLHASIPSAVRGLLHDTDPDEY